MKKNMKKALAFCIAVLMIVLTIPFTLLTFAEEATEIEIANFSVFGRHSDDSQTKLFFNPSCGAERAFDGDIGTEAQTKNGGAKAYEMCYIDADGKMRSGTNASGTSYCGIFIVELSSFAYVDTLSLWGIDSWGFGWMSNDGYDIYYSADGETYTAVAGASFENFLEKQDTADALYVPGTYNGTDGYVHDIAMGDVAAKYIAIAVSDYVPASDNPEKEMIFFEIVVTGTAPKLMLEGGASVRKTTPTGLRFTGYANKSYVDGLKTETNEVTLGMLITPTDYLVDNELEFTKAALDNCNNIKGNKYLEIDATKVLTDGDNYKISCAIVNILEYNYDREFSAILYVKVTEGDTTEYVYSAYNKGINSRSVAYVASLALSDVQDTQDNEYKYPVTVYGQDKYSPYDAEDRKVLENFSKAASLITVMTYNVKVYGEGDVWDKWFGNEVGWDGRNPVYALETITEVMPDVVGLQEDDDYLYAEYKNVSAITENYTRFNSNGNGTENNEILVKTSKFEVLDDGVEYYKVLANDSKYKSNAVVSDERVDWDNDTKGTNAKGRFFRWVLVKDKDTGEQFLVVNTHLHYMAHLSDEEALNDDCNKYLRKAQATLLKLWLTDMSETCANQIVMGDLNSKPDAQSTKAIVEGAGALDMALEDAAFKGDVGGTLVDSYETRNSHVFDYVLYNSDSLNALEYSVIDNYDTDSNYTKYPSDHLPVYAKFIVK